MAEEGGRRGKHQRVSRENETAHRDSPHVHDVARVPLREIFVEAVFVHEQGPHGRHISGAPAADVPESGSASSFILEPKVDRRNNIIVGDGCESQGRDQQRQDGKDVEHHFGGLEVGEAFT